MTEEGLPANRPIVLANPSAALTKWAKSHSEASYVIGRGGGNKCMCVGARAS